MPDAYFNIEEAYTTYRPLLYTIAYRMLASSAEAEDVVQDIFTDLADKPFHEIDHVKAYLTKIVTNRCVNVLQSARIKRATTYPGTWLPEPDIHEPAEYTVLREQDPAERLLATEQVSYALLVALEILNPLERAIFILRETLSYSYREMAGLLGRTEAACRQTGSRAKRKLDKKAAPLGHSVPSTGCELADYHQKLTDFFMHGARSGNFTPFIEKLSDDAKWFSDSGGKVRVAVFPIYGRKRISMLLEGLYSKGFFDAEIHRVYVNGQVGLQMNESGGTRWVICWNLPLPGEAIQEVYLIMNPDKLGG